MSVVRSVAFLSLASSLAACSAGSGGAGSEQTAQASLSITTVPQSVQCIQISVSGPSTVTQSFAVTGGASSVGLSLGDLPLGWASVTGQAFDVACGSIGGQQAAWVADGQVVDLRAGEVTTLTLDFRQVLPTSGTANFIGTATAVAESQSGTVVVLADGTTDSVGPTGAPYGQQLTPTGWPATTGIAADGSHTCALAHGGTTAQCWDSYGAFPITGPVTLSGSATQIATGNDFACAFIPGGWGAAWCWGANNIGQLGNGTTWNTPTSAPREINVFSGIESVSAGNETGCAVETQGSVVCWGSNQSGKLGTGSTATSNPQPSFVSGLDAMTQVSVGDVHVCALRADGAVFCWGDNSAGELGNGTYTQSSTPVQVAGITNATQVAAYSYFSCAVLANGGVRCWGRNTNGNLGDGTGQTSPTPVAPKGLPAVTALASGPQSGHVCALTPQGGIWCWGANDSGQLATSNRDDAFVPIPMPSL